MEYLLESFNPDDLDSHYEAVKSRYEQYNEQVKQALF